MSRRPRRNHSPAFKAKVARPPSRRSDDSPAWPSISTFTPIRSPHGNRSLKAALRRFRTGRRTPAVPTVDVKVTACQDR